MPLIPAVLENLTDWKTGHGGYYAAGSFWKIRKKGMAR